MVLTFGFWFIVGLYAAACGFYWRGFLYKQEKGLQLAQRWFWGAILVHLLTLILLSYDLKRLPVATLSEAFTTFVWLTGTIYYVLERRLKDHSIGAFILPLLLIMLLISNITFDRNEPIAEVLKDVRFEVHVLTLLLAYGAFALSFIASLLHTLLSRELQKHDLGMFYSRLPSLPFFDRISNSAVDIGLIFLTIGLILGAYNAALVWQDKLFTDPKIYSAFLSWIIYGIHFAGRRFGNWYGQRAATISLIGFGWLIFSFVIISMYFSNLHHFV